MQLRSKVSARCRLVPGRASKYISRADEIQPGDKVVLWLRVSGQGQAEHLKGSEAKLRRAAEQRGAIVVGVFSHVVPGYDTEFRRGPCWGSAILRAAKLARKHGAKLLAESTDRFVRHPASSSDWQDAQARDTDLDALRFYTDGVMLVTLIDPDATLEPVRSFQTKRGQQATGQRGGRPRAKWPGYKKQWRQLKLPEVLRLKKQGLTLNAIVRRTGVKRSTIRDWIAKYGGHMSVSSHDFQPIGRRPLMEGPRTDHLSEVI